MSGSLLPHVTEVEVRFRDLDGLAHVNNAVYFTYLEVARTRYWWDLTGDRSDRAFNFILGKAECTFKSPAVLGEVVVVRSGITRMGNASFTWEYVLTDKVSGRLIAQATTEQVAFDYAHGRTTRITEAWRERILAFQAQLAKAAAASPPSV